MSGNPNQSCGRLRQLCVTTNNCALGYYTGTLMNLAYGFDNVGNVTALRDDTNRQQEAFAYDPLNRLISAIPNPLTGVTTTLDYTETYGYTPVGNFISKAGVTQYYSSTKPHAATGLSNGAIFTYDANGNMTVRVEVSGTQRITYTQTWDVDNRLIDVLSVTQHTQFFYDADGALIKKVDPRGTTTYVGADDEITWLVPTQTITTTIPATLTHKLYLPMVSMYTLNAATGISTTYYRFNSARVAMRQGNTLYWLSGDHLGSASLTTDISGTKVSELRYKPYGDTRYSNGETPTDKRFTSQEQQGDIGLYAFGARFLDPQIGRFVSADTIVPGATNPQALNRYSYGVNNPIKYTDPSGHCFGWAGGADTAVCTGLLFAGPPGWVVDAALIVAGIIVVAGVGIVVANQIDQANKAAKPGQVSQQSQPPAVSPSGQVGSPTGPGGFDPNDLMNRFSRKFNGKPGADSVLREVEIGGTRGQGAQWQMRYAVEKLNADDVVGFEQPGTTGRVDIITRSGSRIAFVEAKEINWYALENVGKEGQAAARIMEQMMGHAENQTVFSKLVINATGNVPQWFVNLFEQEGIAVEVFHP